MTVWESACDLRIGQVGIATLKLRRMDIEAIAQEMSAKVQAAPQLLGRAAVIVDLNTFPEPPEADELNRLLATLREAGVLPAGLTYGSPAIEALARAADLPLFSRFRGNYEPDEVEAPQRPAATATPEPEPMAEPTPAASGGVRIHEGHVRSGQRIYARGHDLTVLGHVSTGAEVIADGNVHIYGALRGRALAGAAGDTQARVFCREFGAELVAVAGTYRVLEDADPALTGRSLNIRLEGERLLFESL